MHKLDFLSGGPKTIIFERDSNKTNLGGVLTLIYSIIVILIFIAYIYEFSINNKYTMTYSYDFQIREDPEFIDDRYYNENYNPELTYSLDILGLDNKSNFKVFQIDDYDEYLKFYEREFNVEYNSRLYDLYFLVLYNCSFNNTEDGECKIHEEDIIDFNRYKLSFTYLGFNLEHQNEESPLGRKKIYNDFMFSINEKVYYYELTWKTIEYSEEKGISEIFDNLVGKSNTVYGGQFLEPTTLLFDYSDLPEYITNITNWKILGMIYTDWATPKNFYDKYSRKKKSIFDSLANICSLSMTVYSGFIFVFCGFYSSKYDNYKIVEKILLQSKKGKDNKKINYDINKISKDFDNDYIKTKYEEEKDLDEDINKRIELTEIKDKKDSLLDNTDEDEKIIVNKKESDKTNKEKSIFPDFHFYEFFFNNVYTGKCCSSKNQEIISACDEIVSKYYTIERVLYNQLKLENLFKDYKWNNPELNTIENHSLINNLNLLKN